MLLSKEEIIKYVLLHYFLKFEDVIGFIKKFMSWTAFHLATRRVLLLLHSYVKYIQSLHIVLSGS